MKIENRLSEDTAKNLEEYGLNSKDIRATVVDDKMPNVLIEVDGRTLIDC